VAVHDHHAGTSSVTVEKVPLDDSGLPQPTGELEEFGADTLVLAIGQSADLSLLTVCPVSKWRTASSRSSRTS
jgi:hypothetical protein